MNLNNTTQSPSVRRLILNGRFQFYFRTFICQPLLHVAMQDTWIKYDSLRDTQVEVYDLENRFIGIAKFTAQVEVSNA